MKNSSERFLKVVYSDRPMEKGKATTLDIKRETGLTRGAINYQFEKLSDKGYITVETQEESAPGGGHPLRVAVLTDEGRDLIERGEISLISSLDEESGIEGSISNEKISKINEDIKTLARRVDTLNTSLSEVRGEIDKLEEKPQSRGTEPAEEQRGTNSGEELEALEERVDNIESKVSELSEVEERLSAQLRRVEETLDTYGDRMTSRAAESRVERLEEDLSEVKEFHEVAEHWMGIADINISGIVRYISEEIDNKNKLYEYQSNVLDEKHETNVKDAEGYHEYMLRRGILRQIREEN